MKDTITIRLPAVLRRELQAIGRDAQLPVSDVVRLSLQRFVALYRFRRLRARTIRQAERQGLLTDDDIFAALS